MKIRYCLGLFAMAVSVITFLTPLPLTAGESAMLSKGQTVYVPAYSHIYHGNKERPFLLAVTLSIRNIDPEQPVKITLVDFYETQGKLLKKYLDKPISLRPLESIRYIVPQKETTGGSGANFIVEWQSEKQVNPPIIESVMIGTQSTQGISFTSRGQAITKSHE